MAQPQTQEMQVKGEFSTAEVTHVLEALRIEGQCYIKNHLLMALSGTEGPIREWHDNVTRANLDRLRGLAQEMGLAMPFPKPLEERENEMKEKLRAAGNVRAVLTEGEAIAEIKTSGKFLAEFYTVSMGLATHDRARDAFRQGFENVADNLPRVLQALKGTENYFPPPNVKAVEMVGKSGVPVGQGGNMAGAQKQQAPPGASKSR